MKKISINITEGYLSITSGIFSKSINDVSISKMQGISLSQSWVGKIFNFGTLVISTGGVIQKFSISNPMQFRKEILDQI